jgi:uncharacterized protein involved in exopolysaccharide biosynthesis
MRYEVDIFHYLALYKKAWKRIVALTLLAGVISAVLGYLKPTVYRSTAIILSPKEGGNAGAIGRYLGLLNTGTSSSDEVVFSILKSARMRKDINERFKDVPNFWWSLDTYVVTGGFAIEVKGPSPDITEMVANFSIGNLDKINTELQVTPQRPMVKVLDPAVTGAPMPKHASKKAISSMLFVFMAFSLFIFFREYFSQLKVSKK